MVMVVLMLRNVYHIYELQGGQRPSAGILSPLVSVPLSVDPKEINFKVQASTAVSISWLIFPQIIF